MNKQTLVFYIKKNNGEIEQIGRSIIEQQVPRFQGGEIKWLPEKFKSEAGESRGLI